MFGMSLSAALVCLALLATFSEAFMSTSSRLNHRRLSPLSMASFGDANYKGFTKWCEAYGEDQKEKFPQYFSLPEGVYEVLLEGPLGIVFEEVELDGNKGVFVSELKEGGNAEKSGLVSVGDKLLATTAVIVRGAKFERPLFQADIMDYDSIISALKSNFNAKFRFDHAILQFLKEDSAYPESYMTGEMRRNASPLAPMPN